MSEISTSISAPIALFTESELLSCSMFNLKMFLLVITILLVVSCIMSLTTIFTTYTYTYGNKCHLENMDNVKFLSYKVNPGEIYSQNTILTNNNGLFVSGEASRIVSKGVNNKLFYNLNLYCNLYVLYGSPFGETNANSKTILEQIKNPNLRGKQQYLVFLVDKDGNKMFVDKLYKESDGIYKLKHRDINHKKYTSFNNIIVIYKQDVSLPESPEEIVLSGNF
jgi:hypothetical protein